MTRKIIFVCTANAGRSPALAVYTGHYAKIVGVDVEVDSAGSLDIAVKPGGKAGESVRRILGQRGFPEIEKHKAKLFNPSHGDWADYILTATEANRQRVLKVYSREEKVHNARDFVGLEGSDIEDAYFPPPDSKYYPEFESYLYKDIVPKNTPAAWELMIDECKDIAEKVVEKLNKI